MRCPGGAVHVNKHQGAVAVLSSFAWDALYGHSSVALAMIDTCWSVAHPCASFQQSFLTEHDLSFINTQMWFELEVVWDEGLSRGK